MISERRDDFPFSETNYFFFQRTSENQRLMYIGNSNALIKTGL